MERNKGGLESRTIETRPVTAEEIGFPFAAQAARLVRQREGRPSEEVALVTSVAPQRLDAAQWLRANRAYWGIESGVHQRLDTSMNDDRCRVRNPNGLWILGMFRRLANSLFIHWRRRQPNPQHLTFTHFQAALSENHLAKALRFVTSRSSKL